MENGIPLIFPTLISVLVIAIMALAAGLMLSWRELRRQQRSDLEAALACLHGELSESQARTEALLLREAEARIAEHEEISRHVETIQSDVEWIAGEKMIEQVMTLVRENMPVSQISRETGLSHEKITTLATFRTH
ncbi:MAG: hypothetical protein JJU24_02325 [Natronohydrobacter sp.]|nr:hypothetical protein [Natronohydrobacter sp.]